MKTKNQSKKHLNLYPKKICTTHFKLPDVANDTAEQREQKTKLNNNLCITKTGIIFFSVLENLLNIKKMNYSKSPQF